MNPNSTRTALQRTRLFIASMVVLFVASLLLHQMYFARPVAAATSVFINEIHYDNASTDTGEAIEIAGPAGTDLTGWSIVLYNGASASRNVYNTNNLSGVIPNQQGGFGTRSFGYAVNGIQNGNPDGIALVNGTTVVQFLSYGGTFTAADGPAIGMTSTDIGVTEPSTTPVGQSLRLSGTGCMYEDFTWNGPAASTFGAINTGQTSSCGGGDIAPTVSSTSPTAGAINVAVDSNIVVNFSESVNATASAFSVECPTGSPHAFSQSGSPNSTFTLDPTSNLPFSTVCTVKVTASQISDADINDPPDQMANDATFSFTTANPPTPVATNVVINEIDADTPGADTAEFIELYDGGVGNTPLDGLVVVLFNGSNDLSYNAFDLDGQTTDANGYFVLGNTLVPGRDLVLSNGSIQNENEAVALYAANATDFPNGTPVSTANLRDAIVYDNGQADDAGLLVLLNGGEPQVNEGGSTSSIGRCPNGTGGARNTSTYLQGTPSSDGANACPPPPVARTIPEIQGNGMASPFVGTTVITTGIVTGRKTNGFFVQDPVGDGNNNTSDGIFVFTSSTPSGVAVGDFVQLTGGVSEFESSSSDEPDGVSPPDPKTATEITGATIAVMSSGNPLPPALDATALSIFDPAATSRGAQLEKYEFMRVSVTSITVSEPTNEGGEFWGVEPPRARPFRDPGIEAGDPVPAADDGLYAGSPPPFPPTFDGNFERVMVDSDDAITAANVRRVPVQVSTGAIVTGISGPLDFAGFSTYRIVLDASESPGVTPGITAAVPVPVRTAGEFTIGHANLENFSSSNVDRLNKASLFIRNVLRTPDILGVIEIDNLNSLQQLAAEVNADASDPGVNYVAYISETANSQDIGYLVNDARVDVLGTPQQYNAAATFTYCNENDTLHDRPSLILTANMPRAGGGMVSVTVILNHTKSLLGVDSPRPFGTCGTGTQGARNREKRRLQAEDIANLIQAHSTENLVVLGDLNAFDVNDGLGDIVGTFKGSPAAPQNVVEPSVDSWTYTLVDMLPTLLASERYSYTFEGNAQVLDHVLINSLMQAQNTRFAYSRNNADFSESYAADASRPERLSDHDAPVAYFLFPADNDDDGVPDAEDNCPAVGNPDQANTDDDAQGDACDADDDNDGTLDTDEADCGSNPLNAASTCEVCDGADNDLDSAVDEGFTDTDGDSQADCVDADDDNDGTSDTDETICGSNPLNAGSTCEVCDGLDNDLNEGIDEGFPDNDDDGLADCVDPDDDNDTVIDAIDNCPFVANLDQADADQDGIGNACDAQTGPPTKDQCKNGGWQFFNYPRTFNNQGDCIQFVNTGK